MNGGCTHCGRSGHSSGACPEEGVKLFGVTLSSEQKNVERGIVRSVSAGDLVPEFPSSDTGKVPGKAARHVLRKRSPLGVQAVSVSRLARTETPTCRLEDRLTSAPQGRTQASRNETSVPLRLQTEASGKDTEEQEGRSEDVFSSGRGKADLDAAVILRTDEKMPGPEGDGYMSDNGGGPDFGSSNCKERKKGIPWTEEEHRLFLLGLSKLGKGDWRGISRNFVLTRTPTQVASHAQKYFIRQNNLNKRKRRASLLDISTDSLTAESEMLRSMSTPSLPTLAEDVGPTTSGGVAGSAGGTAAVSGIPSPFTFGSSFSANQTPASPPETGSFPSSLAPHSPGMLDAKMADISIVDQHSAQDLSPYVPGTTASALYGQPSAYPAGGLLPYPQDSGGYLSAGFRPFYIDFSRSHSFPAVGMPGSMPDGSGLTRPSSLPSLGSPVAVGSIPGRAMEGAWAGAGVSDMSMPYWSNHYVEGKAALDAQTLAAMDPAVRHRLGHEMMMEMMNRQLSTRMAEDFSRTHVAQAAAMGPGAASLIGPSLDYGEERKTKAPKSGVGGNPGSHEDSLGGLRPPYGSAFLGPSVSLSPSGAYPRPIMGVSDASAAAATAAVAAAAAAHAAAAAATPARGSLGAHPMSQPWYMAPYSSWVPPYGSPFGPPQSSLLQQSISWPVLGQGAPGADGSAGAAAVAPAAAAPTGVATDPTGVATARNEDPSNGKSLSPAVLRPTAVLRRTPISIPTSAPASSDCTDSEQEPARALMLLSKGLDLQRKATPASDHGLAADGDATEPCNQGTERDTPKTLQLFDVSERPSAFHPQPCPAGKLSPEPSDVAKSPISVP